MIEISVFWLGVIGLIIVNCLVIIWFIREYNDNMGDLFSPTASLILIVGLDLIVLINYCSCVRFI